MPIFYWAVMRPSIGALRANSEAIFSYKKKGLSGHTQNLWINLWVIGAKERSVGLSFNGFLFYQVCRYLNILNNIFILRRTQPFGVMVRVIVGGCVKSRTDCAK